MAGVEIDTRIEDGDTEIEVIGTRDVAVVVRSEGDERIYLPPEEFRQDPTQSPYRSSYGRADGDDESPYREAPDSTRGVVTTPRGFRIHHDGSATEIDVYREP